MVVVSGRPGPVAGKPWKNPNPKENLRLVCQASRVLKLFEPGDQYIEAEKHFWDRYWWGIHGLYVEPENLPGNPNFRKFDPNLITPELRVRAIESWPSVLPLRFQWSRDRQSQELWAAQYNKKGPRSGMDQNDYMDMTLNWFKEVETHIIQAIKSSMITNYEIDVGEFDLYFSRTQITRPVIRVFYHQQKRRQYLRELHFNCTLQKPYIYLMEKESSGVVSDLDWSKRLYLA